MIVGNAKNRTLAPSLTIVAAVGVVGVFFPIDSALRFTLIAAMAWAVAAIGLDLLVGYSGQLSFGQAAYVGCGAYAVTALRTSAHMPLVFAVIVGVGFVVAWSVSPGQDRRQQGQNGEGFFHDEIRWWSAERLAPDNFRDLNQLARIEQLIN